MQKYFRYLNYEKIITSSPYLINSCDQYILIPCKTIVDQTLTDVTKKEECFLNININNIVLFKESEPSKLTNFLSLKFSIAPPKTVIGDPNCIFLEDNDKNKINFCLNNKSEALQIIKSIMNLKKCKNGEKDLHEEDEEICFDLLLKSQNKDKITKKQKKVMDILKRNSLSLFKN